MSPYPQLKGPHARVHIPNSRGHTQSSTCGLLVGFTVQANGNNNKNMSQSPIAKGLHPYNTHRTLWEPFLHSWAIAKVLHTYNTHRTL